MSQATLNLGTLTALSVAASTAAILAAQLEDLSDRLAGQTGCDPAIRNDIIHFWARAMVCTERLRRWEAKVAAENAKAEPPQVGSGD